MSALIPNKEKRTAIVGNSREVLRWVLLTLAGWWMVWLIIYVVIYIPFGSVIRYVEAVMVLVGPITGGVGAFLGQRRYLRERLPGVNRWPVYSFVGWIMGYPIGQGILENTQSGVGWGWVVCGCILGVVQSFALYKKFRQAFWWVLISIIAWGAGGLFGDLVQLIFTGHYLPELTGMHFGPPYTAQLILSTILLISSLISGIGLMILFRKMSLAEPEQNPLKEP